MDRITGLFPLWAVLISAAAVVYPAPLIPLKWTIVPLLGVVMLGMGVTLTTSDFTATMKRPLIIALGVVLQFLLMPLIGWLLTRLLSLPLPLAVGVILVGAAPGGTASNVITYLARGDVALSITLTSMTTMLAVNYFSPAAALASFWSRTGRPRQGSCLFSFRAVGERGRRSRSFRGSRRRKLVGHPQFPK